MIYTIYFLLLYLNNWTNGELFTAIVDIEHLLKTQKKIIDILDSYFHKEEKRLATIKKYLNEYQRQHKKAIKDIPTYLSNPINAFILLKRLSIDLDYMEGNIVEKSEYKINFTMIDKNHVYPTQEDLRGAAQAISRLQETYNLDVEELAKGKLKNGVYSTPMTAGDCYELGRAFYKDADYVNVYEWMMEAFRKYTNERFLHNFKEVDILEYIIFAYYSLGDMQNALKWTYTLLDIDPKNSRAKHNLPLYSKRLADEKPYFGNERNDDSVSEPEIMKTYTEAKNTYDAHCRGEMILPTEIATRLTCRYMFEKHAFLKIAPMKMEMKYINPDVILFHNVISDSEINTLKQIATLKFKPTAVTKEAPKTVAVRYRVSKSAWLNDKEFDIAARISRRVADMTGLNLALPDRLQVVNYGIGGHYEPHFDTPSRSARQHEDIPKDCTKNDEDKMATVMFYLSDVPLGGATVFTKLHLGVYPVKGAAVFWLNMHASGERNLAMTHAGCPVLLGSKWVCNKWIPQCGQELIKPCNLVHQKETDANNFKIPRSISETFSERRLLKKNKKVKRTMKRGKRQIEGKYNKYGH